jgi:hypothetical protein
MIIIIFFSILSSKLIRVLSNMHNSFKYMLILKIKLTLKDNIH